MTLQLRRKHQTIAAARPASRSRISLRAAVHSVLLFALSFVLVVASPFGISNSAQAQTALRPPVHIPPRFPVNDPGVPRSLNGQSNSTQYIHSGNPVAGGRISDATLGAGQARNAPPAQQRVAQRQVGVFDSRARNGDSRALYGGVPAKKNIGNIFGTPPRENERALSRRAGLQDKIASAVSGVKNRIQPASHANRGQQVHAGQPVYSDGYPIETVYQPHSVVAQQPTLIDRRHQSQPARPRPIRQIPSQQAPRDRISSPVRSIPDLVPDESAQTADSQSVLRRRTHSNRQADYYPQENSLREIQTASHSEGQFSEDSFEPGDFDFPDDKAEFDVAPQGNPQFRSSGKFVDDAPLTVQANPPRNTTRDFDFNTRSRFDDNIRSTVKRYSGRKRKARQISILRSESEWQD